MQYYMHRKLKNQLINSNLKKNKIIYYNNKIIIIIYDKYMYFNIKY